MRRPINQESYEALKEYVLRRQQREQLNFAIPKKMGISQVAAEREPMTYADAAAWMGAPTGQSAEWPSVPMGAAPRDGR